MRDVTVLGGGFAGSAVAERFAREGHRVRVLSRSDPYQLGPRGIVGVEVGDIAGDRLRRVLDGADVVVLAAGGLFPARSLADPIADLTGSVPMLIEVCEAVGNLAPGARFLFLSSAGGVYAPADGPIDEATPPAPATPYGVSRVASEAYVAYYADRLGLDVASLRVSYSYGRLVPAHQAQNVVSAAFRAAVDGTDFRQVGGGVQARDFVHIDDVAAAVVGLAGVDGPLPPVVNVGTGLGSSVLDIVHQVEQATGRSIRTVPIPATGAKDLGTAVLDVGLLKRLIPFVPRSLQAGIGGMAAALRAPVGESAADRAAAFDVGFDVSGILGGRKPCAS